MHAVMERADTDNALVEERLAMGIAGVKVSGQFDLYTGKGVLIDFKTTSVWTRIYGSRDEDWERQLNCYAHLLNKYGFAVNALQVVVIYRDWHKKGRLKSGGDYPVQQAEGRCLYLMASGKSPNFYGRQGASIGKG